MPRPIFAGPKMPRPIFARPKRPAGGGNPGKAIVLAAGPKVRRSTRSRDGIDPFRCGRHVYRDNKFITIFRVCREIFVLSR